MLFAVFKLLISLWRREQFLQRIFRNSRPFGKFMHKPPMIPLPFPFKPFHFVIQLKSLVLRNLAVPYHILHAMRKIKSAVEPRAGHTDAVRWRRRAGTHVGGRSLAVRHNRHDGGSSAY